MFPARAAAKETIRLFTDIITRDGLYPLNYSERKRSNYTVQSNGKKTVIFFIFTQINLQFTKSVQ